uniref:Major facilitator superfamily domain containing 2B n=1 Tax=Poecilia mexicana TaxID=48701 RepID=A0A3B3Y213_9TELE
MPWDPLILGCTPFLVVSYFCLWFVPPFVNGRFVWYLVFYCLYQTLINEFFRLPSCFHVSYSALTMFISTDQKERDSATAYRMTVEVMGTLLGAAIQGQIVASAHSQKHCSSHNMSAGSLGNSSGAETVVPFQENLSQAVSQVPFVQGFLKVMGHGPYIILTAAFLLITVAVQVILTQSNFVLFCTYAAGLREHFQNIVVVILVSALLSIPFWQWFLKRFGKKTAAFCGITWIMPFSMLLVFIPNLVVAYIVAVSSGLSIAASLLLPWSMLPDVVDDFRLANSSSKGHEAIFYSFYVFFVKFAAGITLGVSTLCLQFAGYETRGCSQPPPVVYTLKLLIGAAPIAFIVTGLMILVLYPITEDVTINSLKRHSLWSKQFLLAVAKR